jgi:hypothetical protein
MGSTLAIKYLELKTGIKENLVLLLLLFTHS